MKPKKAFKKPKKGKKQNKADTKAKKAHAKKIELQKKVFKSVIETLQANSEGEFDLPSFLVRYTDRNHSKYNLGLHRESYIPQGKVVPYHNNTTERALQIYGYQSGLVAQAIFGGDFPIKEKEFKLLLCEECE